MKKIIKTLEYKGYSVTIYKDVHGFFWKTLEGEDWADTLRDAEKYAIQSMKYIMSDRYFKDIAADKKYVQQEKYACGCCQ